MIYVLQNLCQCTWRGQQDWKCVLEQCGHFCREKRHCETFQQNLRVKTMLYLSDIAYIWRLVIRDVKSPLLMISDMVLQSCSSSSSLYTPVSSFFFF